MCHDDSVTGSLPPNHLPPNHPPPNHPPPNQQPDPGDDTGIAGSVTGEWVEVYQPDGAPEESPPPVPPVAAGRSGVVAVVLFVATLLLVIVGSVTPLFNASIPLFGGQSAEEGPADLLSADAWQLTTSADGIDGSTPRVISMPVPIGYPLALAALLLLVAVALWLRAGQRPPVMRVAKPVGLAAAVFLAGLVISLGMFELAWDKLGSSSLFTGLGTGVGSGYWTLLAAAGVGVAAAVLAYRVPQAAPEPEPAADEWTRPAEPDAGVPPGQPAEWPVVAVIPTDERTDW